MRLPPWLILKRGKMSQNVRFPCYGVHLAAKPYLRDLSPIGLAVFAQDLLDVVTKGYGGIAQVVAVGADPRAHTIDVVFRDHEVADAFLADWSFVGSAIRNEQLGHQLGADPADLPF